MNRFDHVPDALFGWPHADIGLARGPLIELPKRVSQEVEAASRYRTDPCLLLVDRQPEFTHQLAHADQRLSGVSALAQDDEIVCISHDASAEALIQLAFLPSQHEPAHIQIRQQW